jgi:hypothetical protein
LPHRYADFAARKPRQQAKPSRIAKGTEHRGGVFEFGSLRQLRPGSSRMVMMMSKEGRRFGLQAKRKDGSHFAQG